jgi:outer membrane protein OmpA-like peptidoglycan-associated protein
MKKLVLAASLALLGAIAATPVPTRADAGAPAAEELVAVVYFAVDSDELDAEAKALLDPLVARALADPKNVSVIVRGHTEVNEAGQGPEYGIGLAQRRASNVGAYFYPRDLSMTAPTIMRESFGQARPPAKGGKARRVEVFFGKGPGW